MPGELCGICGHKIIRHDMKQLFESKKKIPCSDCPGGLCIDKS